MVVPPVVTGNLEMVETQFVFQLPIVLFDRPAAAREPHQFEERGRGGPATFT